MFRNQKSLTSPFRHGRFGSFWLRATAILLLSCCLAGPVLAAQTVSWVRHGGSCQGELAKGGSVPTEEIIRCGGMGTYLFATGTVAPSLPQNCTGLSTGTGVPAPYPASQASAPLGPLGTSDVPCSDGSCFAEAPGTRPWAAVVDWRHSWHGAGVAWTLLSIAGRDKPAVLYGLDDEQPSAVATDFQVLKQLCAIAEENSRAASPAPAVINLSFGRPLSDEEELGCPNDPDGTLLICELKGVLDNLRSEGSWLVASAGNHGEMLFPASHTGVLSVGSLDNPWFFLSGQAEPSWQSPAGADALMPSSAICLDNGFEGPWSPPPGSSFATAVMSGWLLGSDLDPGHSVPSGWQPVEMDRHGTYGLRNDVHGILSATHLEAVDQLMYRIESGAACHHGDSHVSDSTTVHAGATLTLGEPNAEPIIFLNGRSNRPTPDPDPCLPCSSDFDDGPGGGDPDLLAGRAALPPGQPLIVSFEASPGVPGELKLVDLMVLRSRGEQYYTLHIESKNFVLREMEKGRIDKMAIHGLENQLIAGDSISFVYLFEPSSVVEGPMPIGTLQKALPGLEDTEVEYFWSSTPIYVVGLDMN